MIDNAHEIELDQQKWREKFPSTLSALFSFYQCLCTIAIIGCELGSILIDLFNATIYVGFWASIFFMIAWISQLIAVTCRRTRRCAKFTLIIQCITLFFSICVIGFDAYFLILPTTCFFPLSLCNSTAPTRGVFYSEDNFNNIKIPLIKGQLATAAIMFAFGIDYIIMYVATYIHIRKSKQPILQTPNEDYSINNARNSIFTKPIDKNVSSPPRDTNASFPSFGTLITSPIESTYRSRWSDQSTDINPIKI